MFKDFYAILEIPQSASAQDIKAAYRKQAFKWHPDKNPGFDTTEKMKEINEAKLILLDDEARIRYDKEYIRFKSYQKQKEKERKTSEYADTDPNTEQKQEQQEQRQEYKERQDEKSSSRKEDYKTYTFEDEILKKWMENARKQAIRNVHEMISEFRDSSAIGFGSFFSNAAKAIVIALIFFVIMLIIKSLSN